MTRLIFLFAFILLEANTTSTQIDSDQKRINSLKLIKTTPYDVWDVAYVQNRDWTELYKIPNHPAFDSLLTKDIEEQLLKEINSRRHELNKDTLSTSDYFYVWKPYFDWLQNEDPHYRIEPITSAPNKELRDKLSKNIKDQKRLPFHAYSINDSVVIRTSYDDKFKCGDLVLAINNIPMAEYAKYYSTIDILKLMDI